MKIERTYMFNVDKYVKGANDYDDSEDEFEILYDYINKENKNSRTIVLVHLPKNDGLPLLLGNDVSSMFSYNKPFATIYFNSTDEFNSFVMPEWLGEFEYVE